MNLLSQSTFVLQLSSFLSYRSISLSIQFLKLNENQHGFLTIRGGKTKLRLMKFKNNYLRHQQHGEGKIGDAASLPDDPARRSLLLEGPNRKNKLRLMKFKINYRYSHQRLLRFSFYLVNRLVPRSGLLCFGNSQKSQGGEYGGCGTMCMEFLKKWSRRTSAV